MTKQDLLPYCFFYKGKESMSSRFVDDITKVVTSDGLLWRAEKFVCEKISKRIDKNNVKEDIAAWVGAFVCKWSPYKGEDIMDRYWQLTEQD